jgi:hypothetical protein
VVCGQEVFRRFKVRKSEILSGELLPERPADRRDGLAEKYADVALADNAGRRWVATATAEAALPDDSALVGTLDGILSLVKPDGSVYVLGVAGDTQDVDVVFTYSAAEGLRQIERIGMDSFVPPNTGETLCPDVLTAVSASDDGKILAVGSGDYKSGFMEFYLLF